MCHSAMIINYLRNVEMEVVSTQRRISVKLTGPSNPKSFMSQSKYDNEKFRANSGNLS